MARKITSTYCESTLAPRSRFAPGSFRWIKSGRSWVLIGCPKGKWGKRNERCRVGTDGHKLLRRVSKNQRCRKGEKRIKKG